MWKDCFCVVLLGAPVAASEFRCLKNKPVNVFIFIALESLLTALFFS